MRRIVSDYIYSTTEEVPRSRKTMIVGKGTDNMTRTSFSILVSDADLAVTNSIVDGLKKIASKLSDSLTVFTASTTSKLTSILSSNKIDALFVNEHLETDTDGTHILDRIKESYGQMFIILLSDKEPEDIEAVFLKYHEELGERFEFLPIPCKAFDVQSKYLEIREYFDDMPYPFTLAYPYESLLASHTSQGKITAMRDFLEAVTKYSFAVLISDLVRLNLVKEFSEQTNKWKVSPTLSAWLQCLADLLEFFQSRQIKMFMPELPKVFYESNYLDLLYRFVKEVQDPELVHGYVKGESWYEHLAKNYAEAIQVFYKDLSFTARYPITLPKTFDFVGDSNASYEYQVRELMGAEIKFGLKSIKTSQHLKRDEVYVSDMNNYMSLSPWYSYKLCNQCSMSHLYVLEEIQPIQLSYNAFCNHRILDTSIKANFDSSFSALFEPEYVFSYEMIGPVGKTDHSFVEKGWDPSLKRLVAIKSFSSEKIVNSRTEELLLRGAEILGQLRHPNIGQVYHVLRDPLRIVMEWIEGISLYELIESSKKITSLDVIEIGIKLADALDYVHQRGIVHRDIKPGNIILRGDADPVLIDFDIAMANELHTISHNIDGSRVYVGTIPYSAPEQLNGKVVGPYSDLFSLGCVLYEVMANQRPYDLGNDPYLYHDDHFPEVQEQNIPKQLYRILVLLLQEKPELRPNAKLLKDALMKCRDELK